MEKQTHGTNGLSTGFPAPNSHSIQHGPEGAGGSSGTEAHLQLGGRVGSVQLHSSVKEEREQQFLGQATEVDFGLHERSWEMRRIGSSAGCDTRIGLSHAPLQWLKGTLPVPLLRWAHPGQIGVAAP